MKFRARRFAVYPNCMFPLGPTEHGPTSAFVPILSRNSVIKQMNRGLSDAERGMYVYTIHARRISVLLAVTKQMDLVSSGRIQMSHLLFVLNEGITAVLQHSVNSLLLYAAESLWGSQQLLGNSRTYGTQKLTTR